jgi:4a-hydroxytetrahydrobiopterin dehydratase
MGMGNPIVNPRLDEEEIPALLSGLAPWRREGKALVVTFRFAGFREAMGFVHAVAERAEAVNHHPDITIRWNRVSLELSTHSAGGLTAKDFTLAADLLAGARERGALPA